MWISFASLIGKILIDFGLELKIDFCIVIYGTVPFVANKDMLTLQVSIIIIVYNDLGHLA